MPCARLSSAEVYPKSIIAFCISLGLLFFASPALAKDISTVGSVDLAQLLSKASSSERWQKSVKKTEESTYPQEWSAGQTSFAGGWVDVTYGAGRYVAVAFDGTIGTSTDGRRWSVAREGEGPGYWSSISYGDGKFVALTFGSSQALYSTDGLEWSKGVSKHGSWADISYGKGQFIAVSAQGGIQASQNGQDWYWRMRDSGNQGRPGWRAVDYYQGQFVAAAESGQGQVAVSANGWDWELKNFEEDFQATRLSAVAAGSGRIIAGDFSGGLYFSVDGGDSWQQSSSSYSGTIADIIYADGYFVAVTKSSVVLYSEDGNTWERTNAGAGYLQSLALGDAGLLAIGNWGSGYGLYALSCCPAQDDYEDTPLSPPAGVDWQMSDISSDKLWRGLAWGENRFVATSPDGEAMTSSDGFTWSESEMPKAPGPYFLEYGEGRFVGVVFGSQESVWSEDGVTWEKSRLAPANGYDPDAVSAWSDIHYASGKFVAVSTGGGIQTSPDGITWNRRADSGEIGSTAFRGVTYGNGTFLAVGESGENQAYTSKDGISWKPADIPASRWQGVAYGNGLFAAVSINGDIAFSEDGKNWQMAYSEDGAKIYSIVFAGGQFLALARDTINIGNSWNPQYLTRMFSSENGRDWFQRAANLGLYPDVAFGNDRFVSISGGKRKEHVVGVSINGNAPTDPEVPAEEGLVEEVPAEEVPAEEGLVEEVPAEEVPAEEGLVEEVPAEEVPAEESAKDLGDFIKAILVQETLSQNTTCRRGKFKRQKPALLSKEKKTYLNQKCRERILAKKGGLMRSKASGPMTRKKSLSVLIRPFAS